MNAKLCKRLRGAAQGLTVGKPERNYIYDRAKHCIINSPHSTRGVYLRLKKDARNNAIA